MRRTLSKADLGDVDKEVVKALSDRDMSDREMSIVSNLPITEVRRSIGYLIHAKVIKEI